MNQHFLTCLAATILALVLVGCPARRQENACVAKGQVCCVVDTGPSQDIQMCVPDGNACLAKRPADTTTPYPRPHTETAVDLCTSG